MKKKSLCSQGRVAFHMSKYTYYHLIPERQHFTLLYSMHNYQPSITSHPSRCFGDHHSMKACLELPPLDAFFSSLNNKKLEPAEHRHAQKVWNLFECQNMLEYCELYCRLDVLLLAEVFENFRAFCMQEFHLDPAYYIGLPGLR